MSVKILRRVISLPGLNLLLYITTSERIRAAYRVFLKDMLTRKKERKTGEEYSDTQTWWEGLRQLWVSEETQL